MANLSIQVISFNCVLKNKIGTVISNTFNREVITSLEGESMVLQGLARGLQNIKAGEKRKIILSAQEAYGFYEPAKVILYPKKKIGRDITVGENISIIGKSGLIRSYRVIQLHHDMVSLDSNHPLAGQDLIFEIETLDAREATEDEIASSKNAVSAQVLH